MTDKKAPDQIHARRRVRSGLARDAVPNRGYWPGAITGGSQE